MTGKRADEDPFVELEKKFGPDGTHPDFPEKRYLDVENIDRILWSDLLFDLPALAVYRAEGKDAEPVVGMVIALCHELRGTRILVRSSHNGRTLCHPIEESPSGLKLAYLLVKRHAPMCGI